VPPDGNGSGPEYGDEMAMFIVGEERPVSSLVSHEVAIFNPDQVFAVSVASASPAPEHLPDLVVHL